MTAPWDTLPCGRDPRRLLAHAAERTVPGDGSHEATCPYCQAALGELHDLWRPMRDWADRDIETPDHFVSTIVRRVRTIAQSPHHVATVGATGTTTVNSWVLGLITSAAVGRIDDVAITGVPTSIDRRAQVRYGADNVGVTEVGASDVAVAVGLTAKPVADMVALADRVRDDVMAAIRTQTTIRVDAVDISVDDLDEDGWDAVDAGG